MAWYEGAIKLELQPESDSQPAIKPTQFIFHSIAAPWDEKRIYEYWRDSTNLESHFGLDYDGSLGQFIGTETRADANYRANLRPDGTGAISLESASNLNHTDPWTAAQIEASIKVGVWAHKTHGIPLRICRTAADPGFGYHSLHADWSNGGTACPGAARIKQFREVVFPGIVARATGAQEENDMALSDADVKKIWDHGISNRFRPGADGKPRTIPARYYLEYSDSHFDALMAAVGSLAKQVTALAAEVKSLKGQQ